MERRKICRYFERGSCKKQKCPFVHLRQTRKNCQFYLQGFCKKGDNCNFYHPPKQSQAQKNVRKNYKPTIQKKQKHKDRQENYQHENRQQNQHEPEQKIVQKEQQHSQQKIEQKVQLQNEQQIKQKQQKQLNSNDKQKQINFLLGIHDETQSSQQDGEQLQKRIQDIHKQTEEHKKRKPLNFIKTYPKKFPDYTKSAESKQKIAQNEKTFFKGIKFSQFISKIEDSNEKQYYQLVRKFQDSFTIFQQETVQKNDKLFVINLRPLLYEPQILLHFEMSQDSIHLKVDARQYPKERAKFSILNVSIPQEYKHKFIQCLNKIHQKKSIFQTLKTFMNTFEKNYQQTKSKLQNEYFSRIQLQSKINKKISQQMQKKQKKNQKKQRKIVKQKTQSQNPDLAVIKYQPTQKINVGNMNYDIRLQSLLIQNAEYVLAQRFLLFLECHCQKKLVHILQADRKQMRIGVKLKCKKCQMIISIAIQRQVMQLRSHTIGMLGIQNGRLLQVGGVSWKIGCSCDAQIIKPRICLPGYRLSANCQLCFRSMQVSYMGLKIHNPFFRQNQQIEDGKQLPGKGACKHMKLSFRWIRYGCCGRTFSCDECHVNGSVYGHDKIQGATMLCGYCSIEQPVNSSCSHCKKELVRGVDKGGHWEGGLGCRDKNLLSKKDAKKYAGLTKQQNK